MPLRTCDYCHSARNYYGSSRLCDLCQSSANLIGPTNKIQAGGLVSALAEMTHVAKVLRLRLAELEGRSIAIGDHYSPDFNMAQEDQDERLRRPYRKVS
jgi:hypothetical protein